MYPKEGDYYRNAFIHRRVINYKEYMPNIDITVFVLDNKLKEQNNYSFESINVIEGNKERLLNLIEREKPKKLLIHFLDRHMMNVIEKINFKIPVLIWVHGAEALGWYRRLFNFDIKEFPKYMLYNTIQMFNFRRFIKLSRNNNVTFIFVSKWMKNILEADTLSKVTRFEIIPNPIDDKLFKYQEKSPDLRKKILLIRPFASKKYANDIAINAILHLSKKPIFNDLEFTIYGKGKYFDSLVKKVEKFENVKVFNKFLSQQEIAEVHKINGVFLCPTRQDAQGVSMCEAMSSGLVPITSNNTAIPEFVEHKKTGLLTEDEFEIATSIEYLYNHPNVFSFISENASKSIREKCQPEIVISRELKLICE
jgi:glycosyltransferase involved in cell wall biosynthesis